MTDKEYIEKIKCKICNGTGTVKDENGEDMLCPYCKGTGHALAHEEPVFELDTIPYGHE